MVSTNEKMWVKTVSARLEKSLNSFGREFKHIFIETGYRLPYAFEVLDYKDQEPNRQNSNRYETDLIIFEETDKNIRVPRVVVECKLAKVTTHDALTYSTKAYTHKHVHPYLRYGILIGQRQNYAVPGRLFRHGVFFDFMATWTNAKATTKEWNDWLELLRDEIIASRTTEQLLTTNRKPNRKRPTMIHRRLVVK